MHASELDCFFVLGIPSRGLSSRNCACVTISWSSLIFHINKKHIVTSHIQTTLCVIKLFYSDILYYPTLVGNSVRARFANLPTPMTERSRDDGRLRSSHCLNFHLLTFSICSGMLLESNRDEARFRRRLEQFGLCVQRPRGNMVGHTPFRESRWTGSELP